MNKNVYASVGVSILVLMYVVYLTLGSSSTWLLYTLWALLSLAMLVVSWVYTEGVKGG